MKKSFLINISSVLLVARPVAAQIALSDGTYAQNFDSLAASGASIGWTNNVTLPGWYASKGNLEAVSYIASTGSAANGSFYSFGAAGVNPASDRAFGSIAASSTNYAYGVRFTNDTALTATNFQVSFSAEQWRNANGTGAVTNTLAFSYQISSTALTNADAINVQSWTAVPALNFFSPVVGGSGVALDGNASLSRQVFANAPLGGAVVLPGQEIFLRWRDIDDAGSDAGLAVDDLSVSFQLVSNTVPTNHPPIASLTNSSVTLLTYNVKGNGTTNWSTNAPQVQAIGRQLMFLQPDIITFNEIPYTNTYQMASWVTAFLPGYFLATNSGTDGSIRSVIMSRFPITRRQKWLDGADLKPFGYTNTSSAAADNFTRDLYEAEIAIPNWPLPLHVFTTHLKSTSGTTYADASAKRAAEAAAITNFFATNYFVLYPTHPFTLAGDMNDGNTNALAIQRLISAPTTLRLTNPTNPFTGSINTFSIQGSVSERIDYIFPCDQLRFNIIAAQVFRTDLLTNFPVNLFSNDNKIASDHLPVLMTFANPFNTPFKILSLARTDQNVTLNWESQKNRTFNIESSSNLISWTPLATNLYAATTNSPFVFSTNNVAEPAKFFRVQRVP
jgi:endonuclease/exonuclease/phosphatase family metal-dependent hydrolase